VANNDTRQTATPSNRIPELDGVRGLAILMVLAWHYFTCSTPLPPRGTLSFYAYRLTSIAWSGVDLFFVLSGLLIGGIILNNGTSKGFARNFILRRVLRIGPLYAILLVIAFVINLNLASGQFNWIRCGSVPIAAYAFGIQNFYMAAIGDFGGNSLGVTWSLAVEEQFYGLVLLVFTLLPISRAIKLICLLGLAAPMLRTIVPGFHTYVMLPFRLDSFALGVLVAVVIRHPIYRNWLHENIFFWCCTLFVLAVGVVAVIWKGGMGEFQHTFFAVFYANLILISVLCTGCPALWPLRTNLLKKLGAWSYGIYLFHQLILGLIHGSVFKRAPANDSWNSSLVTLTALAVTLGISALLHRSVEEPCINFARRFGYK